MVQDFEKDAHVYRGTVPIQCEICHTQEDTNFVRRCHICGKMLCSRHYTAGLCPEHFADLPPGRAQELVQVYEQWEPIYEKFKGYSSSGKISGVLCLIFLYIFGEVQDSSFLGIIPVVAGVLGAFTGVIFVLSIIYWYRTNTLAGVLLTRIFSIINLLDADEKHENPTTNAPYGD
ncbi:MAG TPA: hypothetical protein VKK79_25230 [Candidatus Lokiarchaeia archaeon]|nr:hypothetical protein [Candidatus Lokiarchaeia archaeon]